MPNNFPTGNAFLVNTPAIDRVGAMMINDEKQRQLAQQREAQALDNEFSKSAAAIRDADVPKYSQLFSDYKNKKIDLYRNGNRMSNQERIAKEMEAQRAMGNLFSFSDKSRAGKLEEDDYYKGYRKAPDKYEDIAPQFLAARRNTPTDELEAKGLQDIGGNINLRTTDFSKAITNAMGGKPRVRNEYNETTDDGLNIKPYKIEAYNSPREYATILGLETYTGKKQKHLLNQFQYPDQKANEIMQRYNDLAQTPIFQKAYPNEQPFTPEEMADPLKRNINLMAMEHILLHPPMAIAGKQYLDPLKNKRDSQEFTTKNREDNQQFRSEQNAINQDRKDKRVAELIGGIKTEDPYEMAIKRAKPIAVFNKEKSGQFASQRVYDKEDFSSVEGIDQEHYNLLTNNGQIPLVQREVDGKPQRGFIVKTNSDGKKVLVGGNGMVVNRFKALSKLANETRALNKAIGKGEIENPVSSPTEPSKGFSLNASDRKKHK